LRLAERGDGRIPVADVAHRRVEREAQLLLLADPLVEVTRGAAARDDLEAFLVQALADRGTDAAHATGDVCDFLAHLLSPVGVLVVSRQTRSTARETPMPPPMHSAAMPFFASRRCISCSSVTRMRAPDAPIGWPMAIAPPFTLTLAGSIASSLLTAQACAANASLSSNRLTSCTFQP